MKLLTTLVVATLALASIVALWFLINNLQPLSPGLYSFAIILLLGIGIFLRLFAGGFLRKVRTTTSKITQFKYFTVITLIVIALLAIIARLYFYNLFSYNPASDPGVFYTTAQQIANGVGMAGDDYTTFFPFLAAYNNLLGLAMGFFNDPWLATIALNVTFDIAGAFIAYYLIKRLVEQSSMLPILAFVVWLLNPFNILFSILSLPISVVSFFIITAVLLVYLLVEKVIAKKTLPSLVLAGAAGIAMGIGNCFRPVFIIAVIALFVLFIYLLVIHRNKKVLLLLGSSFLIITAIFFGIQTLNLAVTNKQTGLAVPKSAYGWSVYLGSNFDTDGTWSLADQTKAQQICPAGTDAQVCHDRLLKVGLERYKSYGLMDTINLFVRKLYVFSSHQSNTYNANDSLTGYAGSNTQKVFDVYIRLFMLALFSLSAWFLYKTAKVLRSSQKVAPVILFSTLLILGFFFSSMLIETAERYAQILYPLFTIYAVLSFGLFKRGSVTRD